MPDIVVPIHGKALDASTPISSETAKAMREAGYLGVTRCYSFVTAAWAEPTREEIDRLLDAGLGVGLYAFWRASGHSEKTGRDDAWKQLAKLDALNWPIDVPGWVDLECKECPKGQAAADYAGALSEEYDAAGRVRAAYYDRSFALSGANLDDLFDIWWQSGARAELAPKWAWRPPGYVMSQSPWQSNVAGHPVDFNEARGVPMLVRDSAADWLAEHSKAFLAQSHTQHPPDRKTLPAPE